MRIIILFYDEVRIEEKQNGKFDNSSQNFNLLNFEYIQMNNYGN